MTIPTLTLLIGPPGSGKTTYTKNYVHKYRNDVVHLSSDKIRQEIYGDEAIQGNPEEVFGLMRARALDFLDKGTSVIWDATNMSRKDRASIISVCPKYVQINASIIWCPISNCIKHDLQRGRTVGKEVIDRMLKKFQAPWYDEGFSLIDTYYNADYDWNTYNDECLQQMNIPHDNSHHTLSIFEHCNTAKILAEQQGYDWCIQTAAQLHDVGKPYCKTFVDTKGNESNEAHYYGHEGVSAWMSYGIYKVLYVSWLISNHMAPYQNSKYYNRLPTYLKEDLDKLHKVDVEAH